MKVKKRKEQHYKRLDNGQIVKTDLADRAGSKLPKGDSPYVKPHTSKYDRDGNLIED